MKKRVILYAEDGKILTDGNIYGKEIFLALGATETNFYELDEQEFLQKQETAREAIQEVLN